MIGDTSRQKKRGAALGVIGAVFGIAFVIGPFIGGTILQLLNWRWLFVINLPIAALVVAMGLRLLPATRRQTRLPFDWAGTVVLGLLLACLALGINQIDVQNFGRSCCRCRPGPTWLLPGAHRGLLSHRAAGGGTLSCGRPS